MFFLKELNRWNSLFLRTITWHALQKAVYGMMCKKDM